MRKESDQGTKQSSQATPFSMRLTRRKLLATAAAAMLAGCAQGTAPQPTATPTPPFALGRAGTIYLDGTVPPALGSAVVQSINNVAGIPNVTAVPSLNPSPDLILTFGELPPGYTGASGACAANWRATRRQRADRDHRRCNTACGAHPGRKPGTCSGGTG